MKDNCTGLPSSDHNLQSNIISRYLSTDMIRRYGLLYIERDFATHAQPLIKPILS